MSGENSYLSRFFVKFVEVSAAGLATAISAYALAHFGGLLSSSPTPASAPGQTAVQVSRIASEVAGSLRAQPTPPAAAAAVNKQSPAPDTDAPVAQPARKAGKDAKALPPSKHTKTDTSVAEKEPRGQKSAEALARAELANVDAIGQHQMTRWASRASPTLVLRRSTVQAHEGNMPARQADVGPQVGGQSTPGTSRVAGRLPCRGMGALRGGEVAVHRAWRCRGGHANGVCHWRRSTAAAQKAMSFPMLSPMARRNDARAGS